MKQLIKSEKGYTLLLAVVVVLIFSILGLSLITLTTNGLLRNETREEGVQSKDLADKGIDYLVESIQAQLQSYINTSNIGKAEFKKMLMDTLTLSNLSCSTGGVVIPGDIGETRVCIDGNHIEDVYVEKDDGTKELQELKKKIRIVSTGFVDGKENVTTAEIIVGTDAIPDQLRYALSTNNGGNLYLHGGVEINGDIKTDGNLIISEYATWLSGNTAIWQPSVSAKLSAGPGSATPKIIFSKENNAVYKLKEYKYYEEHIAGTKLETTSRYTKFNPTTITGKEEISNLFFNSSPISVITKPSIPQDTVEITNKITERYNLPTNKANYTTNLNIDVTTHPTRNYNKKDVVFVSDTATQRVQETYTYMESVCLKYGWVWNWIIPSYECIQWGEVEKTGTRLVDKNSYKLGNMTINGGSNKKDITLRGTYFVYGDLTIVNANLKADAIMYVQGKVDISESTIQGVDQDSTLIIFSNGNIDIYNMSVNSSKEGATKIKGFFYTKQDMIMYGVGSNINLTGGISARRLILTAVRGDTKNGYLSAKTQGEIRNSVATQYSRLKILYDEDLITSYTAFNRDEEEEYIKSINEPEIVDRK